MLGSPRNSSCEKKKYKMRKQNALCPTPSADLAGPPHLPWGLPQLMSPTPTRISLAKSVRLSSENFLRMLSFSSLVTAEQCGPGFLIGQSLIGNRKAEDKLGSGMVTI